MRKVILIDKKAQKEITQFPRIVQLKFQSLFEILEIQGKLEEPFAKKLNGHDHLFEIRVKQQGQWRIIYAYVEKDFVIILSAFAKKSQKTPLEEIEKARVRLKNCKD